MQRCPIRLLAYRLKEKVSRSVLPFKNREISRMAGSLIGQRPRKVQFVGRAGYSWRLYYDRFTLKCFEVTTNRKASEVVEITRLLRERDVPLPAIVA